MNRRFFLCIFLVLACLGMPAQGKVQQTLLSELKTAVVNIKVNNNKFFGINEAGTFVGTGFVIDLPNGLVVTCRHVADCFPSQIKIQFIDGSSTFGKLVYFDATQDFSIIRIDPKAIPEVVKPVKTASFFSEKIGNEVVLIANNEGEEYTVKQGEIVELVKNKGPRHGMSFQTSFDRTGGSSGAPVFNSNGEVVGLHFSGSDTSSFELPIDYITDQMPLVRDKKPIARGEIGVRLDLIKTAEAQEYMHCSPKSLERVKKDKPETKWVPMVRATIIRLPASEVLMPGDVVIALNGETIGDNLYRFDKIIDQNVGKSVKIEFVRNGKEMSSEVAVQDAEKSKLKKFVVFGGATIHDLYPDIMLYWDIMHEGVYISQAESGSNLDEIGINGERVPDRKGVVILAVDGVPVKNLEDFLGIIKGFQGTENINITYKDYQNGSPVNVRMLTLDLTTTPTMVFTYNPTLLQWEK